MGELSDMAIKLAVELCGGVEQAIELLDDGNEIKAEYWRGIRDSIYACNRMTCDSKAV